MVLLLLSLDSDEEKRHCGRIFFLYLYSTQHVSWAALGLPGS